MSLNWLYATRFRNLVDLRLDLSPGINLVYGANGSGKTSLLEAAYFLSSARSHRTIMQDPVIQRGKDDCLVRGELFQGSRTWLVGIARNRSGERQIRLNGEDCARASELAQLLPTLVLGPESVDLLIGPPDGRRRFLNWGLFHVEHSHEQESFTRIWEEANRCLRQRNRLLREGISDRAELVTWSEQLASVSEGLDQRRTEYMASFAPIFARVAAEICDFGEIDIHYQRGWEQGAKLSEIYEKEAENDEKRGFTQKGFQRADVRITVNGQPAVKVCSRGELKALVWSMVLAQGALPATTTERSRTLYLIDDLASEFDAEHRSRVGNYVAQTGNQVLLTGVDLGALEASCGGQHSAMFHVKHGQLTSGDSAR